MTLARRRPEVEGSTVGRPQYIESILGENGLTERESKKIKSSLIKMDSLGSAVNEYEETYQELRTFVEELHKKYGRVHIRVPGIASNVVPVGEQVDKAYLKAVLTESQLLRAFYIPEKDETVRMTIRWEEVKT